MHNMFTPIAASPDGQEIVYTRVMNPGGLADLMLIENFKLSARRQWRAICAMETAVTLHHL